jgi:hypothetical protein
MTDLNTVLKAQSFPPIDVRVAWAITVVCLIMGLLLTLGVLRIQIGPLPGWAWLAIILAQILTAVAVAGATHLSSRKRNAAEMPQETGV